MIERATTVGIGSSLRAIAVSAILGAAIFLGCAGSAQANSPITSFSVTPSTTQAGGHPDIIIEESNLTRSTQNLPLPTCSCEDPKDVTFNLPTGVVGNPHSVPLCSVADFGANECPIDSQVGTVCLDFICNIPVFGVVPPPAEAGLLGFNVPIINGPVYVVLNARTGSDYGLSSKVTGITHLLPFESTKLKLWGVPADPSNDPERYGPQGCTALLGANRPECSGGFPSNAPVLPFLESPTSCGAALTASVEILSYDHGTSQMEAPYPGTTGCDQLSFNPSLFVQPTTQQTDSASGSDVDLSVPQETSPSVPSPSEIRDLTVELPPGFTLTPNASDGKTSCSNLEARFGSEEGAHCPEFSKVGTVTLTSSLLPGPLPGYIYIGDPQPEHRYRFFATAEGFNTNVKIEGLAEPNPQTGQLTLNFPNLPETPFEDFFMHFFGSERGLLATPTQCGTYPVNASFTPWDTALPEQHSTQFFVLDSGPNGQACPPAIRPFSPSFQAGVSDGIAGAHSPFTFSLIRNDGDQELRAVNVTTPPGFSATLAGIPYCPDAGIAAAADPGYSGAAQLASPSCPAASQVGTSDTGTGAGTHPVYFPGKVYLAGPYKGAPLSLAVITPGVSGPYDLGSVVVRAAVKVNPTTAQITAVSDPLPQILQGIPLRLRSIQVNLDRKNFALNPTNCDPFSVGATVFGDQGAQASLQSHFQVANCANLPFAPKFSLKLSGGVKRAANPALKAVLTYPQGGTYANVASTAVTLPPTEIIDNAHIQNPCTRVEFAVNNCPASSILGNAVAETPLLDKPLEGPVYLMSGFGHKLPDLVADLKGQINIVLDGRIDTVHRSLRTTFETVPDAPISKFTLILDGGKKGLLQNNASLCHHLSYAIAKIAGQNGKTANQTPELQTPCSKRSASHTSHRQRSKVAG